MSTQNPETQLVEIQASPSDGTTRRSADLEEARQAAVAAAMTGDLFSLATALEDRAAAIAEGQSATIQALAAGEDAKGFLEEYVRSVGLEATRIKQMQGGFSAVPETLTVTSYENGRG